MITLNILQLNDEIVLFAFLNTFSRIFTLCSCVCIIVDIRCTIPDFFSCPCLSDATWPPFGYLNIVDDNREEMFVKRRILVEKRWPKLQIYSPLSHFATHISQTLSHFATGFGHFESLRNVKNPLLLRNGFLP